MDTLPKPVDDRVTLVEVPERTVAVVRFSGSFNDSDNRAESLGQLTQWLNNQSKYKTVGKPLCGLRPPLLRCLSCVAMRFWWKSHNSEHHGDTRPTKMNAPRSSLLTRLGHRQFL